MMKPGSVLMVLLVAAGLLMGVAVAGLPPLVTFIGLASLLVLFLVFAYPVLVITLLVTVVTFNVLWVNKGARYAEIVYATVFVALVISWICRRVVRMAFDRARARLGSPLTLPVLLFLALALFNCALGIARGNHFEHWASNLNALMYYGLCFMMLDLVRERKTLMRIFYSMVASLILGLICGLWFVFIKGYAPGILFQMLHATLSYPSVMCLLMFVIMTALAITPKKGARVIIFGSLALFFGVMLLALSARSLWIAALFGLSFLFFVAQGKERTSILKAIPLVVMCVSLYIAIAMALPANHPLSGSAAALSRRYVSIFTAQDEPSMMTRRSEWIAAKQKALRYPIIGNGLGTEVTFYRYDNWFGGETWYTTRYIHNAYLSIVLNMGFLGLASFLWLCFSFLRYAVRLYHRLTDAADRSFALGIGASFATLMVASLAGPLLTAPALTIWLGFFAGALIILERSSKEAA